MVIRRLGDEAREALRFRRFEVRRRQRELLAEGRPVELGSRALEVLLALIDRAQELVTKSELMKLVWPERS